MGPATGAVVGAGDGLVVVGASDGRSDGGADGADDALAGKYYTLLEVDPGVPENGDNWFGVYTHGMWANFQAGQTFNSSNANVIMHASGAPPFGSHRYTFVLFEQMDGYKDLSTYREAVTGQTAVNAYSGHFLKQSAGVGEFARNFDLKVATATYYYQYCTASVMADVYAAYYGYGDGSTCLAYCSFDPDGSACTATSNTALYGKAGCPCKDATFGAAFVRPTSAPTHAPTYTNEAISQWAGTGDEGLFLTLDSLGLVPGNGPSI